MSQLPRSPAPLDCSCILRPRLARNSISKFVQTPSRRRSILSPPFISVVQEIVLQGVQLQVPHQRTEWNRLGPVTAAPRPPHMVVVQSSSSSSWELKFKARSNTTQAWVHFVRSVHQCSPGSRPPGSSASSSTPKPHHLGSNCTSGPN